MLLLAAPEEDNDLKERLGCLISEVVVPGWNPEQHQFINEDKVGSSQGFTKYRYWFILAAGDVGH